MDGSNGELRDKLGGERGRKVCGGVMVVEVKSIYKIQSFLDREGFSEQRSIWLKQRRFQ
jgi:hypothetical protein